MISNDTTYWLSMAGIIIGSAGFGFVLGCRVMTRHTIQRVRETFTDGHIARRRESDSILDAEILDAKRN